MPVGSGRRKSKSAAAKEQEKQAQLAEQLAKQNQLLGAAALAPYTALNPALNPMLAAESMLAYGAAASAQQQLLNSAALGAFKMPGVGLAGQWPSALSAADISRLNALQNPLAGAAGAGLNHGLLNSGLDAATLASLQSNAAAASISEDGAVEGRRVRSKPDNSSNSDMPMNVQQQLAALAANNSGPSALSSLVSQAADRAELGNQLNRAAWLQQAGQWPAQAALLNQAAALGMGASPVDLLQQQQGTSQADALGIANNKAAVAAVQQAQQVAYAQMLQAQAQAIGAINLQQAAAQAAAAQVAQAAINNPYLNLYNYNYANLAAGYNPNR